MLTDRSKSRPLPVLLSLGVDDEKLRPFEGEIARVQLHQFTAAGIPGETRRHGGKVVIINNQPTGLDHEAHFLVYGAAGQILTTLADGRSVHEGKKF